MVAMIGTELAMSTLVEDFLHEQVEAACACRQAASWLADPGARDVVAALAGIHERDLARLRGMGRSYGAHPPERGTDHEAQTFGHLKLAHDHDGDGAILEAIARVEDEVVQAYERALKSTILPDALEPAFVQALAELRRRRERLDAAMRLVA
jgi:uncharacterized protein (TIGR02284 family)